MNFVVKNIGASSLPLFGGQVVSTMGMNYAKTLAVVYLSSLILKTS